MESVFDYLTTWSNVISYILIIIAILIKIPVWLFLFAACSITTTSILGTFFITLPKIVTTKDRQILFNDLLCHIFPLFLLLALFNPVVHRTYGKPKFIYTLLTLIILHISYAIHVKSKNNYDLPDKTIYALIILSYSLFICAYSVYVTIIK